MASRIRSVQTTFQAGQIDASAIGRSDIGLFSQSLKEGTNWRMTATGAIERRQGTRILAETNTVARYLPFEFSLDQLFIFALEVGSIKIYNTIGSQIGATLACASITADTLWELSYVQSGDFMFLTHADFDAIQEIQRTATDTFTINDYFFDLDDDAITQMPFTKFADVSITLTIGGIDPNNTLTLSGIGGWTQEHEDNRVQVKYFNAAVGATPGYWVTYKIDDAAGTGFSTVNIANATRISGTAPTVTTATKAWIEEAVNPIRGAPQAIAFHAGRLWMGGFRSLPAHVAASKIGLFWNFDVDDATDDDAIFAPLDSDRINEIRHIVSGQHLQIFSDLSEMHISEDEGQPITPTSVSVRTSTRYGSNYIKPLVFDDASIFVQRLGSIVREYLWNSLNRGYTSNPLSLLSNDIIGNLVQSAIDYGGEDGPEQYAYFLNDDGSLAVYHALRAEERFSGFFPWTTEGVIKSIAVVGEELYLNVVRTINGIEKTFLEVTDTSVRMDGVRSAYAGVATDSFNGFGIYANHTVHVTSENNQYYLGEFTISAGGNLDLSSAGFTATQVYVGLNFEAVAETLPINFDLSTGNTSQLPKRLVSGFARIDSSYDFSLQGYTFTPRLLITDVSLPPARVTGIRRSFMLGSAFDKTLRLVSSVPLDCKILNMGMEVGL